MTRRPPVALPRAGTDVVILYRRPGRATETYRQRVLQSDSHGIVTLQAHTPIPAPLTVDSATILEPGSPVIWFTFPGEWHDIGLFHLADGTYTGLYANVLTPVELAGARSWTTTDLCLDVWIPAEGRPRILDEPELAEAEAAGLVTKESATRAREEAAALLKAHRAGTWPPPVVAEWSLGRVGVAAP